MVLSWHDLPYDILKSNSCSLSLDTLRTVVMYARESSRCTAYVSTSEMCRVVLERLVARLVRYTPGS